MLTVQGLVAGYGGAPALAGVDLTVAPGEVVAVLGRNGAGRSTLARALMGLAPASGRADWQGRPLLGLPPHAVARLGVGYVPETRDVFPTLTVHENLTLGLKGRRPGRWRHDDMYALFPALGQRRQLPAGCLSGGEQQQLALARTLMGEPGLFIADEPTEGLAPRVVTQIAAFLRRLQDEGVALLLIEQKLRLALDLADRVLVMGQGRIVFSGTPAMLAADAAVQRQWLQP